MLGNPLFKYNRYCWLEPRTQILGRFYSSHLNILHRELQAHKVFLSPLIFPSDLPLPVCQLWKHGKDLMSKPCLSVLDAWEAITTSFFYTYSLMHLPKEEAS